MPDLILNFCFLNVVRPCFCFLRIRRWWDFSLFFSFLSDPYLNTDAGTMSPFEHGEVFVLDDGGEVLKLVSKSCVPFWVFLSFPRLWAIRRPGPSMFTGCVRLKMSVVRSRDSVFYLFYELKSNRILPFHRVNIWFWKKWSSWWKSNRLNDDKWIKNFIKIGLDFLIRHIYVGGTLMFHLSMKCVWNIGNKQLVTLFMVVSQRWTWTLETMSGF